MRDARRVGSDTKGDAVKFRALAHTEGMSVPEKANFWLTELTKAAHRGRYDTWTSARDAAARKAKLPLSMAKRIWQRFDTMKDVSGDAVLKLMAAYEDLCERNEQAADAHKAARLKLQTEEIHEEASEKPAPSRVGTNPAGNRKAA